MFIVKRVRRRGTSGTVLSFLVIVGTRPPTDHTVDRRCDQTLDDSHLRFYSAVQVLSAPVVRANPFMRRTSVGDLRAKGVRDISRERTLEVASEPQVGPISQVRPTDSVEAHQPTAARLESCNHKVASCRRPTALEDKARKRASRVNGGKA